MATFVECLDSRCCRDEDAALDRGPVVNLSKSKDETDRLGGIQAALHKEIHFLALPTSLPARPAQPSAGMWSGLDLLTVHGRLCYWDAMVGSKVEGRDATRDVHPIFSRRASGSDEHEEGQK